MPATSWPRSASGPSLSTSRSCWRSSVRAVPPCLSPLVFMRCRLPERQLAQPRKGPVPVREHGDDAQQGHIFRLCPWHHRELLGGPCCCALAQLLCRSQYFQTGKAFAGFQPWAYGGIWRPEPRFRNKFNEAWAGGEMMRLPTRNIMTESGQILRTRRRAGTICTTQITPWRSSRST